ncbi:TIGR03745 family integrating conjugative element membrane protein [Pseudomonas cichorii]|nr:TIGR03745 family integrating conjugative element membrane protein [Pseudomonas cichorii]MBX8508950.1 TIGR03745 family integrating conjugative element membrane protein [Pseudomonas cichorii]MBX8524513.1 TIGR03745 family integrating conjugative element membrane protein [Pseudomonas cichorii]
MTALKLSHHLTHAWVLCLLLVPSLARAAGLPDMEAPSRGEGANMIETFKNYMFDYASLVGLVIAVAAFCGVAYHAYGTYSEVQSGKKTWGQFGLTVTVGGVLLVIIIWLLTKAAAIL